tara:strand:+ start:248 stop:934 length:687 start_codon:yes stop_codon:yes gene_type:complete
VKNKNDVVIVTQARLNSQRIKEKMLLPIGDTSLWGIACDRMKELQNLGYNTLVAAGDQPLIDKASEHGIEDIWLRCTEGCNVDVGLHLIYEWWDKTPYKYCVLINPCLPFLKVETVVGFVNKYIEIEHEGLFGVMKKKDYFWDSAHNLQTPWPDNCDILNTKAVCETYQAAHALYGSRMDLVGEGKWMGDFSKNNPALFVMDETECFDIDYEFQYRMAKILWENDWKP